MYSPEIVDKSIIGSVRYVNKISGTVDYIKEGKLIFRTHPIEKNRLVFQLGSADPDLALQAALTVQADVSAFDLNCGCPKRFSLQAVMGAALLKTPELLVKILEKLIKGTARPVSAKIRLFRAEEQDLSAPPSFTFSDTKLLIKNIIECGVSAVAIHARDPADRSDKHPARWNLFRKLAETVGETNQFIYGLEVSNYATLILNGDVGLKDSCSYERDWPLIRILETTGTSSVMSARAAQWNPLCLQRLKELLFKNVTQSCDFDFFNSLNLNEKYFNILSQEININSDYCLLSATRRFLIFAQSTNNPFNNTKYVLLQIWNNAASQPLPVNSYDSAASSARKLAREFAVKVQQARKCSDFAEIFNVPWIEIKDENNFLDLDLDSDN